MPVRFFPAKTTVVSAIALTLMLPVSACDLAENHLKIDRSTNSEVQDYRDGLAPREASFADDATTVAEGVPELQAYVSDDTQSMKSMPLVSISVNQTIPLRDALFELAKQANYDVQLDPRITGSIIFTARNKPFDVVIDRICEIAGLRYKMEDGDTLRIELDTPYTKSYKVDYLAFVRKNKSQITTDVGISGTSDTSDTETGSKFQITSETEANFWSELDANIKQILASNAQGSYLKTASDPQISLSAPNPNLPPAPPIDESALSDTAPQAGYESSSYVSSPVSLPSDANSAPPTVGNQPLPPATSSATAVVDTSATPAAAPVPVGNAPTVAAPSNPTLRVESLPTSGDAGAPNGVAFTPAYSLNKQGGLVNVFANERLHKQIENYLQDLRRSTTSQVLIEAKVLEVQLNDEFIAGINWGTVGESLGDVSLGLALPNPIMNPDNGANLFSAAINGNDFTAAVNALSRFGTVHALASPRLTVINNQPAVLSVAKNTVYFELDITSTTTGSPPVVDQTVDSEIKTVPEGVLINVLPSIDLDRGQISMAVRPTVTRIDSFKNDPGATIASNGLIESPIPELNVQEIDSVVRMKSGQAMVMGGLLEDRASSTQNGIPVASEIPLIGGLFRSQNDSVRKTELVIFLKATIINDGESNVHSTDRELYKTFGQDRRPTRL